MTNCMLTSYNCCGELKCVGRVYPVDNGQAIVLGPLSHVSYKHASILQQITKLACYGNMLSSHAANTQLQVIL